MKNHTARESGQTSGGRFDRVLASVRSGNIGPLETALRPAATIVLTLVAAVLLYSVPVTAGPVASESDLFSAPAPVKGKFLVASDRLVDPRFRETVVLLIAYGKDGATGIVINQPTEVRLAKILPSVERLKGRTDVAYYGGPVEGNRMLMLIRSGEKPGDADRVFGDVYASASMKTLESVLKAQITAKHFRMYAGYAGWLPGQLDGELLRGDWFVVNADAGSIFEKKPSDVWPELMRRGPELQVRYRGIIRFDTPGGASSSISFLKQ